MSAPKLYLKMWWQFPFFFLTWQIHNISNNLTVILAGEVEQLELLFRTPIKNTSIQHELERLTQVLKHMVNDAATNVSAINSAFSNDVNLGVVISEVQYYETFRWDTEMFVQGLDSCWFQEGLNICFGKSTRLQGL